jgi:hypothetical protein
VTHRILLAALAATALAGGAAAPALAQTPTPDPADLPSTLYLQQASGGTLKGNTLTLRGVDPSTTTFADRPQRTGGAQTTSAFVSGFTRAFGSDAPNAALQIAGAPASRDVALLELRAPRYDAAKRTLTYTVRHLRSTASKSLAGLGARNDGAKVKRFGHATLFIDDGGATSTFLVLFVTIPQGTNGSISLSDGTFGAMGTISGIQTPFDGNLGPNDTSVGLTSFGSSSISFSATSGGGLNFQVVIPVTPTGATLDGTANLPSGATLQAAFPSQGATTINNGAFSLPVPSS